MSRSAVKTTVRVETPDGRQATAYKVVDGTGDASWVVSTEAAGWVDGTYPTVSEAMEAAGITAADRKQLVESAEAVLPAVLPFALPPIPRERDILAMPLGVGGRMAVIIALVAGSVGAWLGSTW